MTAPAPAMIDDRFEVFRIVTNYEALQEGFADRIDDLGTPFTEIDAAGGMTRGNVQKLLSKSDAKWAREFGWKTLGAMLAGTGLALALIVDDARFAPVRERLAKRKRRDKPAIAGSVRPTWLFKRKKAREMGKRRFALMSPAELKRHQRKAGKAGGLARRRKAKESVTAAVQRA